MRPFPWATQKEKAIHHLPKLGASSTSPPQHLARWSFLAALLLAILPNARAATFSVNNLLDTGIGSLRSAVTGANNSAGTDNITFNAALTGTITLSSGELILTDHVNLIGPGPATLAVSGNDSSRVFVLTSGKTILISGLTIHNGRAVNAGHTGLIDAGGGINNSGSLTLSNCVVRNNTAFHTRAGGIASSGTLVMKNCAVSSNTVISVIGADSSGGGIQSIGPTTLNDCVVSDNTMTVEPGGTSVFSVKLIGAGIVHTDTTFGGPYDLLTLSNTIVSGNSATGGTSVSARGGGIYSSSAALIIDSTISSNTAAAGPGTNNLQAPTGSAYGGGLYFSDYDAIVILSRTTLSGNKAIGGNATGNVSGGAGEGGAYFGTSLRVTNCTISGNSVIGGTSQNSSGGDALGGGFFLTGFGGSNVIVCSTITLNTETVGIGGSGNGGGQGGGIYQESTPLLLHSTIVAQNTSPGFGPDIRNTSGTTGSYNLIGVADFSTLVNGVNNNQAGTLASPLDPKLGPLQNNGGPTQTRALLATSPALDKGIANGNPTDQRGLARTVDDPAIANAGAGDATDIGAYELPAAGAPSPTLTIIRAANQATISWPPATPGFILQERLSLSAGAPTWSNSPSGATNPITVPAMLPTKFYRLFKP